MPKLTKSLPKYCKHKASGQAIVTLDSRDYYLGPHGSKTCIAESDRLIAEYLANGRSRPLQEQEPLTDRFSRTQSYWLSITEVDFSQRL